MIVGLDLSLTSTGIAFAHEYRILHTEAVKSTGKRGDSLSEREARIYDIVMRVRGAVTRYEPVLAVIEAPSFGSQHGSAHDRSGLWWGIVRMLGIRNIPVAQVAPMQRAKYATGKGNSKKIEVWDAVRLNYGRPDLPINTDDEADALILAAMGARAHEYPVETWTLSDAQLDVLEKVTWP